MKNIFLFSIIITLLLVVFNSCDKKFDLSLLPKQDAVTSLGDTSYIEITPPWGGFEKPVAITIGYDQLIYVADYDLNEIIMMDAAGTILKRRSVMCPMAIAQNSKLDLYVACLDTIRRPGRIDTIPAIYKIYLVRFDTTLYDTVVNMPGDTTLVPRRTSIFYNHDLAIAPMRLIRRETARKDRRYVGIGIFPENDYLVARRGPDNTSPVDPDTRVLWFNSRDTLITPVADLTTRPTGGSDITDINQLTNITIFPASRDFILTQKAEGVKYGAIWMVFQRTGDFYGWLPKYNPSNPDHRAIDFVQSDRFVIASAAAIDRRRRDIFIIDAGLDSLVKFNRNGRFMKESFGKYKSASPDLPGLNAPQGVAFSTDCTLYIADTGNKIIRRFKLSIQQQCY